MRKPTREELALLIGSVIATGVLAQDELPEVTIEGYQLYADLLPVVFADNYSPSPALTTTPGGAYSANPSATVNCATLFMAVSMSQGAQSAPSQPSNTSLNIPNRYANPIDITYTSTMASLYGATQASNGFAIFPNMSQGVNAAIYSATQYAISNYSITQLVNAWAPPSINPNSLSNVLSGLGISATMASDTTLASLTSEQLLQVIAAFAVQEGFKTSCT